ncbi:GDSL-type esterase/lipase family protein [Leptolyngbya sp. FACHB-261]|uniref:GDSL-type esterase/lipase family protein n=1 Tax=Leptolyngbya sp. FACHB-261 TaxID=2692806 RepID=UPI0016847BAE|nr:GDSL-type esterase/lipase family protein [Leptolyngbya sp. FACHB-261]MBD2101253.1 G-D-S-L family lipolytic protein [Leptolyngbya sp. FACHB-261]
MQTAPRTAIPTFAAHSERQVVPRKFVVLGDSLVYGFGDPEGGGWVERLRRNWSLKQGDGPVLYNLGVRGNTVRGVAERLETEFRNRGELRNRCPDAILLSVGVNDSARLGSAQGRNFTPLLQFEQELTELLQRATALGPVLFVGMVPVNESRMPFLEAFYFNLEDQERYRLATRRVCERWGVAYLDIFERWLARGQDWYEPLLLEDGLHPNTAGHQALYREILNWEALQAQL